MQTMHVLKQVEGDLGVVIIFALIEQASQHPTSLCQRTVWVVLLVSLMLDLLFSGVGRYPGTAPSNH